MASPASASEFVVSDAYPYDRRSPLRWIMSHLLRHKLFMATFVLGAFCNALGAALIPALTGIAFNAILKPQPDLDTVGWIALVAIGSQWLRAVLQFMRNGSAETLAQRLQRRTRPELYPSLLGKTMTFRRIQALCGLLRRATNVGHRVNLMLHTRINMVLGAA